MVKAGKRRAAADQLHLFLPAPSSEAPDGQTKQINPAPLLSGLESLAERLPATIRLGTSSWSFPGWEGLIYDRPAPQTKLSREGLTVYSRHRLLRTVGVDRTYYRPMTAAQFAAYAVQVPETFRFLVKAHEYCTLAGFGDHPRYGTRRGQPNSLFLDPHYATPRSGWTVHDRAQRQSRPTAVPILSPRLCRPRWSGPFCRAAVPVFG